MWKKCKIWGQVEEINDAYKDILEEMGELELCLNILFKDLKIGEWEKQDFCRLRMSS